jgi:ADP-heptose:LPS heptosyltransferase
MHSLSALLRGWVADWLGKREDRYYWRQQTDALMLASGATLLLWQPDGKLGDAIINTSLLSSIHTQRPDVQLIIVTNSGLQPFWQELPFISAALTENNYSAYCAQFGNKEKGIDVFISFETFISLSCLKAIRTLEPKVSIGFDVGRYKLFTHALADHTYMHPRRHISERLKGVCEVLRLQYSENTGLKALAASWRPPIADKLRPKTLTVFLNTFGAADHRSFTEDTTRIILGHIKACAPDAQVIVNAPPHICHQLLQIDSSLILIRDPITTWQLLHLVSQSDVTITPDTALGHIAAAMKSKVVVFYADSHYNPIVWRPMCEGAQQVLPVKTGNVNQHNSQDAANAIQQAFVLAQGF